MWRRVEKRYGNKTTATLAEAQTDLHTKKYRGEENMSEYVDSFECMFDKLANMDARVPETVKIAIFLASFAEANEYKPIVSALKTLKKDDLSWDRYHLPLCKNGRNGKTVGIEAEESLQESF